MPLPLIAALAGAVIGRKTTPKKQAVSKSVRTTKSGKKVKVKAYTRKAKQKSGWL